MPFFRNVTQSASYGLPSFPVKPGSAIFKIGDAYVSDPAFENLITTVDSKNFSFLIPYFRNLVIQGWAAGGAGGSTGLTLVAPPPGGSTIVITPRGTMTALGGESGADDYSDRYRRGHYDSIGGKGGKAVGGDINIAGGNGTNGAANKPGNGGAGANGGAGGKGNYWVYGHGLPGDFPGGGGGGWDYGAGGGKFSWDTGGGGGGGYFKRTYVNKNLKVRSQIEIQLGAGAKPTNEGGKGGDGQVIVSWS